MALMNQNEQIRRPLPAELLSEMFGCLPLANSYGLLAQMPNAILARNVRGLLSRTQMLIFENKWENYGPELAISPNGLESTRNGKRENIDRDHYSVFLMNNHKRPNSVRAQMPVRIFKGGMPKKAYITGYYEVEILVSYGTKIPMGFSTQQFPLDNNFIGIENNSIGIQNKMVILIDGEFPVHIARWNGSRDFQVGDVIGCGIVHSPEDNRLIFFYGCNGQLLGARILPPKYLDIPLFATTSMRTPGDSIRANFGEQKFRTNFADIFREMK